MQEEKMHHNATNSLYPELPPTFLGKTDCEGKVSQARNCLWFWFQWKLGGIDSWYLYKMQQYSVSLNQQLKPQNEVYSLIRWHWKFRLVDQKEI